jgi:hypothetical protein
VISTNVGHLARSESGRPEMVDDLVKRKKPVVFLNFEGEPAAAK